MAQHTRARMADRGCCRPRRLRGSGTVARMESRLPERNASMRLLREVLPGENRTSWPTDFLLFAQAQSVNSPAPTVRARKADATCDGNVMKRGRLRRNVWVMIDHSSDSLVERIGWRPNTSFRYPRAGVFQCRRVRALASAERTLTV